METSFSLFGLPCQSSLYKALSCPLYNAILHTYSEVGSIAFNGKGCATPVQKGCENPVQKACTGLQPKSCFFHQRTLSSPPPIIFYHAVALMELQNTQLKVIHYDSQPKAALNYNHCEEVSIFTSSPFHQGVSISFQ